MEEIKQIKAEWSWGTKWHLHSDNSMVQLSHLNVNGDNGWLVLGLWVNEGYRGKGLGESILDECLKLLPEGIKAKCYLEKNAPQWLKEFYERKGLILMN